jgi:DNA-binding protein HU-beta
MHMNKSELIEAVAKRASLSGAEAARVVDAVFESIGEALRGGDSVNVAGFGSFGVSARAARSGRNPRTGEALTIAAARVPKFKPGKALRDAVN